MTDETTITLRPERPADFDTIRDFVRIAFETAKVRDGREQDFVDRWRAPETYVPALALVAVDDGVIVGHVMATRMAIITATGEREVLLLAPLSVALDHRRRGLGARLMEAVIARATEAGFSAMILVGDPAYYGRFGFRPSADLGITNTDGIPDAYVLARELAPGALAGVTATVAFHVD